MKGNEVKKLNKTELKIKELENQVYTLKHTCDKLDRDKQELVKRNINLVLLMNNTVKEISNLLHTITSTLPNIN